MCCFLIESFWVIAYPAWSIDCVTAVVGFSTYSSAKGRDSSLYDLIYSTKSKERSPGAFGLRYFVRIARKWLDHSFRLGNGE